MVQGTPPQGRRKRRRKKYELPRTSILFFVGLVLVVNEAVLRGDASPRVELLVTYLFMMGLPVAEISDLLRRRVLDTWEEEEGDPDPKEAGP